MANPPENTTGADKPAASDPPAVGDTPPAGQAARPVARPVAVAKAKPPESPPPAAPPAAASPTQGPTEAPAIDAADESRTARLVAESPSWLTSLAIHFVAILILALWSLPQLPEVTANLLLSEPSDTLDELEEVPDVLLDPVELETEPIEFEMQPETEVLSEEVSFSTFDDATAAPSFTSLSELALTTAPPSNPTDAPGFDGTGTTGRGKMARQAMVRKHGGSQASETAVTNALNWLAEHQNPDGTWSLIHNVGKCNGRCPDPASLGANPNAFVDSLKSGTGLALLPYLGAGQTHKQGVHRRTVQKGLAALVKLGEAEKDRPGASWRDSGNMYAHGIAAIALTEAYGMTKDSSLRGPAQAAVDYIVYAQYPDGGWRYSPRGERGDTSVTGWQIMALKSAYLAELSVPPATVARAAKFLDTVERDAGARYVYVYDELDPRKPTTTLSSVGLLCRMYIGWKRDNEALKSGVAMLAKSGPSKNNYYYNYYASQVLFQYTGGQGKTWRDWNRALRQQLVDQQDLAGHTKGSWFDKGGHGERGGRIYTTSLATMCLEIYYRYMPIYQTDAVDREFAGE